MVEDPYHNRLWWGLQREEGVEGFLAYLVHYPHGPHNRRAAEEVEHRASMLEEPERSLVLARLRQLRDPHLPKVAPDSVEEDNAYRRYRDIDDE